LQLTVLSVFSMPFGDRIFLIVKVHSTTVRFCLAGKLFLEFINIGIWANFFYGAETSFTKNFSDSTRKNCYANLQNYFARLTPPVN